MRSSNNFLNLPKRKPSWQESRMSNIHSDIKSNVSGNNSFISAGSFGDNSYLDCDFSELQDDRPPEIFRQTSFGSKSSENKQNEVLESLRKQSPEILKKYFYSKALDIKLKLPKNHNGHLKLISEMFNECKEQQIAVEEWPKFIKSVFDDN